MLIAFCFIFFTPFFSSRPRLSSPASQLSCVSALLRLISPVSQLSCVTALLRQLILTWRVIRRFLHTWSEGSGGRNVLLTCELFSQCSLLVNQLSTSWITYSSWWYLQLVSKEKYGKLDIAVWTADELTMMTFVGVVEPWCKGATSVPSKPVSWGDGILTSLGEPLEMSVVMTLLRA